jgi:hypothetical protein
VYPGAAGNEDDGQHGGGNEDGTHAVFSSSDDALLPQAVNAAKTAACSL